MIVLNDRGEAIKSANSSSHTPLDTATHWDWRNPLNIMPALVLLACVIALFGYLL